MERALFITVEAGDDLILSFAVQRHDDPAEIESLILMRTPKHEIFFEDHERGVKVSFERYDGEEDEFLERVDYVDVDAVVRIRTASHEYEVDVRKVGAADLKRMRSILRKMNYDQRFQTTDV